MKLEIKTPTLKKAAAAFEHVIDMTINGDMEVQEARNIVAAGNGLVSTVRNELNVRLSIPKLSEIEASTTKGS